MPTATTAQKTLIFLRKNALCLIACIFFNELFLFLGARVMRLSHPTYNDFLSHEAGVRIGWLSGTANFFLNSFCRAAFYACHRDERTAQEVSPDVVTLSGKEASVYAVLHSAGFPLFGVGSAYLGKFNSPMRAAVAITAGMALLMSAFTCVFLVSYSFWLVYKRVTGRSENNVPADLTVNHPAPN